MSEIPFSKAKVETRGTLEAPDTDREQMSNASIFQVPISYKCDVLYVKIDVIDEIRRK